LEYQALHFGNNVIKLSDGYYQQENTNWKFIKAKSDVNKALADGLVGYLESRQAAIQKIDLSF
jgi:hypothetical protein